MSFRNLYRSKGERDFQNIFFKNVNSKVMNIHLTLSTRTQESWDLIDNQIFFPQRKMTVTVNSLNMIYAQNVENAFVKYVIFKHFIDFLVSFTPCSPVLFISLSLHIHPLPL